VPRLDRKTVTADTTIDWDRLARHSLESGPAALR
jgi:hypothetical protein